MTAPKSLPFITFVVKRNSRSGVKGIFSSLPLHRLIHTEELEYPFFFVLKTYYFAGGLPTEVQKTYINSEK